MSLFNCQKCKNLTPIRTFYSDGDDGKLYMVDSFENLLTYPYYYSSSRKFVECQECYGTVEMVKNIVDKVYTQRDFYRQNINIPKCQQCNFITYHRSFYSDDNKISRIYVYENLGNIIAIMFNNSEYIKYLECESCSNIIENKK